MINLLLAGGLLGALLFAFFLGRKVSRLSGQLKHERALTTAQKKVLQAIHKAVDRQTDFADFVASVSTADDLDQLNRLYQDALSASDDT